MLNKAIFMFFFILFFVRFDKKNYCVLLKQLQFNKGIFEIL